MDKLKVFLREIYKGWMVFAKFLGVVNATLLLSVTYCTIIPWIAMPRRLFFSSTKSRWIPLSFPVAQERNYKNQF